MLPVGSLRALAMVRVGVVGPKRQLGSQSLGQGEDLNKEGILFASSKYLQEKPSRGDWTPLEPIIAGVRGWEAGLGRLMGDGKFGKCRSCVRSEEVE